VGGTDADPCIGTAFGAVCQLRLAAMCACNKVDDRKPQARAGAYASLIRAAESVERAREEVSGYARALVGDVQLDTTVPLDRGQVDCAGSMRERVLDQVVERLLESCRVAVD
jgi:hypothetical protein